MSGLWEWVIRPALFRLDAERAHELGMAALQYGLAPAFSQEISVDHSIANLERFGLKFTSPLGIAAGFDKNAVAFGPLGRMGFGFIEVGTVTYLPQAGNPKPRIFRLPKEKALINRLGFNNDGARAVAERLRNRTDERIVGVNIGKNRDVPIEEADENYLKCFEAVHPVADYIAVNVSSPNTPGLRQMQGPAMLENLVLRLQEKNHELGSKPLLVKIAPDLQLQEIEAIVDVAMRSGIAGIIATNTTLDRTMIPASLSEAVGEGGLSGKPLQIASNNVISTIFRLSRGKVPVIGVGGVFTAVDVLAKVSAGASLVQIYTGFIYGGPRLPRRILCELPDLLREMGFSHLDDAIGSDVRSQ